jgi:hypothetical protein
VPRRGPEAGVDVTDETAHGDEAGIAPEVQELTGHPTGLTGEASPIDWRSPAVIASVMWAPAPDTVNGLLAVALTASDS